MKLPSKRRAFAGTTGLTLLEVVVVLVILVLIASTAVTATEGLVDESRYQSTSRTIASLEEALLGPFASDGGVVDGAHPGYVADVGRLPIVVGSDPSQSLAELWTPPVGVEAFSIQTPPGDPDVRLPGGWRGPYLRLGVGPARLLDGWAQPFAVLAPSGDAALMGEPAAAVASFGADGAAGGSGFDEDAAVVIERTIAPAVGPRHLGDVPVRVELAATLGPGEQVVVRLYGPVDGDVRTVGQGLLSGVGQSFVHTFVDVAVGPRVLRAYRTSLSSVGADDSLATEPKGPSVPITVVQGGIAEVELTVP